MERKGSYCSKSFLQKTCEYFTADNGLISSKALCLGCGNDGTVYIGTEAGLNYTKADGTFGAFPLGKIKTIFTSPDGTVYFASGSTVYSALNGKISEVQSFDSEIKGISGDDDVHLLTENGLYILKDGKFGQYYFHNACAGDSLACSKGKFMVAGPNFLNIAQGKRKHWMTVISAYSSMPDFKINCITFDNSLGFLWLGTDKGAYIFDCKCSWFGHSEIDALPEEEIFNIRFSDDGRVLLSSEAGLIILKNGKRKYLPAKRWSYEPKLNDAVVCGGSIWTATDSGVTKITETETTLEKKADYCFSLAEKYYIRTPGYAVGLTDIENGDISTGTPHISDNDGLWTQIYVASLSLAYAVTKDEKYLNAARRSMNACAYLTNVSGIKGFTARAVRFKDEKGYNETGEWANEEWHNAPDGTCIWRGETSSDEMTGHFFGFLHYFDLCANAEEKEAIREILCDIVDHILSHNYRLCDYDGEPTTWANWDPELLNRNNMWLWEKGINSLQLLTYLDAAYHVSGDEKYREEFLRIAVDEHYLLNAAQHKKPDGHVCHIDDNLGFLCMATILYAEKDPAIRKYLLMGLKHHWDYERTEHRAMFNLIYGAFSDDTCDLDIAVDYLRSFPTDFVERPIINSKRKKLVFDMEPELWGEAPQLKEALDIDSRIIRYSDSNPFLIDDGAEGGAASPATFLLPYWLGRYYGLIEE